MKACSQARRFFPGLSGSGNQGPISMSDCHRSLANAASKRSRSSVEAAPCFRFDRPCACSTRCTVDRDKDTVLGITSVLRAMRITRSMERAGTSRFSRQRMSMCSGSKIWTPGRERGLSSRASMPPRRKRRTQARRVSAANWTWRPLGSRQVCSASWRSSAVRWPRGGRRLR